MVVLPKPNWLWELASARAIPPLSPDVTAVVRREYSAAWVELASYEGTLYGVPVRAASKSLLWYRPDAFARPPTLSSLEDLETTARALAARNVTPFALPAGEGGGWPLTDWFENILLAERGPKTYEALARHDMSWTHPDVRRAMTRFVRLLRNEWLLGGAEGALELALAESFEATFTPAEPRAAFWLGLGPVVEGQRRKFPTLRPGEAISVTTFPATGVVGVADVAVALNEREATRRLMAFLADAEMAHLWIEYGGYFISPNRAVLPSSYGDPFRAYEAQHLQETAVFVYDLSDRVPRLLTQELQAGLRTLVLAPEKLDTVLARIEEVAGREQGFR
ncbi:MAG: ABC transporter substrate-binding protein [Ardenticatenia bacterium]|nr:ABC transporter substrate-binding protein [Ardenticatenia bacterium]